MGICISDDNYHMLQNLYFQKNGSPAHNFRIVQSYLDTIFANKWIGTNGAVQWPARTGTFKTSVVQIVAQQCKRIAK